MKTMKADIKVKTVPVAYLRRKRHRVVLWSQEKSVINNRWTKYLVEDAYTKTVEHEFAQSSYCDLTIQTILRIAIHFERTTDYVKVKPTIQDSLNTEDTFPLNE